MRIAINGLACSATMTGIGRTTLQSLKAMLAQNTEEGISHLMIIGHNPGMAVLAHWLVGSGSPTAMASLDLKFPTAALAVILFEVDSWQEVASATGHLEHFVRPKDL